MDEHELVFKLKQLAIELGHTPTREEARQNIPSIESAIKKNGGYTVFVQMAGLVIGRARKIDNSVFERRIDSHLSSYEPTDIPPRKEYPTIASISDIHWPFSNPRVIDRFWEYVGDEKPGHVILNGDAWDMYSHSRFPRSHNVFTPREERQSARLANEDFWREIKRRSPESKCVQMLGNHDARPLKKILEEYPEAEDWVREALKRDLTFDGVSTIFDTREELMIEDIMIHHGYRSKLGDHRDYALYNAICGHIHVGGVTWRRIRGQSLFELNSGLAGDPESKGLTYTPQKITTWTPGFGIVTRRGPMFVPV